MGNPSTRWYQQSWGVTILIFLFYPVGLYLMWKHTSWSKGLKWTLTACFVLPIFAIVIAGLTNPNSETASDNVVKPSPTVKVTLTPKPSVKPSGNPTPSVAEATPHYTVLASDNSTRFDKKPSYSVQIDPVNLTRDNFKVTVKAVIADLVKKHGEQLSVDIYDNNDAYEANKEKTDPKRGCVYDTSGNIVMNQTAVKTCLNNLSARMEAHYIAFYVGYLSSSPSEHWLSYFPAATTSSSTVGKYVTTEDFNPKSFK